MPIMTRMRDSMPVILFGLLVTFLLLIVFEWGMDFTGIRSGRTDTIGSINGKKITYTEFSNVLKSFTDNQKTQTGVEPDENQQRQAREQVWQTLVTQQLIEEEIQRLGVMVSDQELVDWVRGDNPPDDLRRNFVDSTGQFRRDLYDQFLSNPNQFIKDPQGADPAFGTKWLADYEQSLRQRRRQEKLQSLVLASVRVTDGEMLHKFQDQNQYYDASYALFDPNTLVKDEDAQLTDADLRNYYDENLDQYKFEASRKLKYVQFNEVASQQDSAARQNEIDDAAKKARGGMDFLQVVGTYSDKPDSGNFFKHGELTPTIDAVVFAAKAGDVIGPILENDGYHLIKVLDERKGDKEFVHASHVLLTLEGVKDSNAVKAKAQQVAKLARTGKDFAALVKEYSTEPGAAQRNGDLGWFTKGRMVKPFEDAAFKAKAGEIVGPVRTQFGLHIIKVHERDSRELKIAQVRIAVGPSSQTKNDLFERARDFTYNAKESDFSKEAQATGFEVRESQVQEKGGVVPGIGINESIIRWAFNNKVGSVSDPFTIPNGYVVLTIVDAKDAGVKSFDEVKESIRPLALRKKKIDRVKMIAEELRSKLSATDSLSKVSALNSAVKSIQTGPFTLGGSVPTIGRDPNFLGTVSMLSVGQISAPVVGVRGAYLIQLVTKTPFDSTAYAAQREALKSQLLQDKRNRVLTDYLAKLKDDAKIEDHRDNFYR
jgi:parvulin-like peptidyl-prolyl isomerase